MTKQINRTIKRAKNILVLVLQLILLFHCLKCLHMMHSIHMKVCKVIQQS